VYTNINRKCARKSSRRERRPRGKQFGCAPRLMLRYKRERLLDANRRCTSIWYGSLHLLYENVIVWPAGVLAELPPAPFVSRLLDGVHWFSEAYRPLVILGLLGPGLSLASRLGFFVPCLLLWCFFAAIALLVQTYSG